MFSSLAVLYLAFSYFAIHFHPYTAGSTVNQLSLAHPLFSHVLTSSIFLRCEKYMI